MTADVLKKRKIAVLGWRSVGKSSLVVQFIENHFVESYYPTIEGTFNKTINYNGVDYECDIIDTAGQDEYTILNSKHAIGINGYVLVYSIASHKSFDVVRIVYEKIVDFYGEDSIPCVIVGAKIDLENRQVQTTEAEELAAELKAVHVETSAKQNINVSKVFEMCLGEIEKRHHQPTKNEERKGVCIVM